jgi:hypothetical protein
VRWRRSASHDWLALARPPLPAPERDASQFLGINRKAQKRNSRGKSPPISLSDSPFLLRPVRPFLFSFFHLPNPVAGGVLDLVRSLHDSEPPLNCLVACEMDCVSVLTLDCCSCLSGWDGPTGCWIGGGSVALSMLVDLSTAGGCADGRLRNPGARGRAAAEI